MCYTCLFATKLCSTNLSCDQSRTLFFLYEFSLIQWEKEFSRFPISFLQDFQYRTFYDPAFSCSFFPGEILFQFIIAYCSPSNIGPKLMLLSSPTACQLSKSSVTFILNSASCNSNSVYIQM